MMLDEHKVKSQRQSGSETPVVNRSPAHARRISWRNRFQLNTGILLTGIAFVYLSLSLSFSWLTPAGEANDEPDHVQYIEHIVGTGSIPDISHANGDESHQPPLYYLLGAAWQKLLGFPSFFLFLPPAQPNQAGAPGLQFSHNYTAAEHSAALRVHLLRLLSVLFGLLTVLLTYVAGRVATGRKEVGLAAALFVAVLPKEVVVSSVVTNDSLVIMLSSLSLVLLFGWLRRAYLEPRAGRMISLLLGLSLGLAALAKFSALPLVPIFIAIMVGVVAWRTRAVRNSRWLDPLITAAGFIAVAGWWFVRNKVLYGQFLAQTASNNYLKTFFRGLVAPVGWFNSQRFLHFVPTSLVSTSWYDGGWNQFILPHWLNISLAIFAGVSLVLLLRTLAINREKPFKPRSVLAALAGSVVAGVFAVLLVAKDAFQAEGRITYVGLTAFAILVVVGLATAVRWRTSGQLISLMAWPLVLFAIDIYVFATVIWPFRAL